MSIVIKSRQLDVKDNDGTYHGLNAVAEKTSAAIVADLNATKTSIESAITAKGQQTIASIPSDYTALAKEVSDTKEDLDNASSMVGYGHFYKVSYNNLYYNSSYKPVLEDGVWKYTVPSGTNYMKSTMAFSKLSNKIRIKLTYKAEKSTSLWVFNGTTPGKIIAQLPIATTFTTLTLECDITNVTYDFNLCFQNSAETIEVYQDITVYFNTFKESNVNDTLKAIDANTLQSGGTLVSGGISDMNNILPNRIYNGTVSMANSPTIYPTVSGEVVTFDSNSEIADGKMQLYMCNPSDLFVRMHYAGSWGRWHNIYNRNFIGGLRKVGIIGDSVSNGLVYNLNGTYTENANCRWGNILFAGKYGADVSYVTHSGATPKTIIQSFSSDLENLADRQVVFVYLGHNAMSGGVGTANDIVSTWNETPSNDTYYAWYSKLLLTLKHYINNNARIVCLGLTYSETATSDCIKDLCNRLGAYFIDMKQFRSELTISNLGDGTHYTALGYSYLSQLIEEEVNKLLIINRADFGNIGSII